MTQRNDINEQELRDMWKNDEYASRVTSRKCGADDITISPQDIFADYAELPSGYRITTAKFDSCGEFINQVDRMLNGTTKDNYHGDGGTSRWTFGRFDIDETREHVLNGTVPSEDIVDGYKELKAECDKQFAMDAQVRKCQSARRKRKKSWSGGNLNVNRAIISMTENKPMACFNQYSKRADRPVIRIGMRVSMTSGNSGEEFARVSAMCAVLSERFESMGYGVEIWGMCVSLYSRTFNRLPSGKKIRKKKQRWACNMWKLKGADERLDVRRVMSQGMSGIMRCFNSSMVNLVHGGACICCGKSPDLPKEIVDHLNIDVTVEKSWNRGDLKEQALRISGKVKEILSPTV